MRHSAQHHLPPCCLAAHVFCRRGGQAQGCGSISCNDSGGRSSSSCSSSSSSNSLVDQHSSRCVPLGCSSAGWVLARLQQLPADEPKHGAPQRRCGSNSGSRLKRACSSSSKHGLCAVLCLQWQFHCSRWWLVVTIKDRTQFGNKSYTLGGVA